MDNFRRWRHGLAFLSHSRSHRKWPRITDDELVHVGSHSSFSPQRFSLEHPTNYCDHNDVEVPERLLFRSCNSKLRLPGILRSLLWHRPQREQKNGSFTLRSSSLHNHHIEFGRSRSVAKRPPKGCIAVYVGQELERFLIPIVFLNEPAFLELLKESEKEFGFEQKAGLTLPCTILEFQEKLRLIESKRDHQQYWVNALQTDLQQQKELKRRSWRSLSATSRTTSRSLV